MAKLLDSVLENSMSVGLQTNLKNAIANAGVKIPSSTCLWQYPEVIRKNLISKTITGFNILGGDVINIDYKCNTNSEGKDIIEYNISTIFDTNGVPRPNYAWENTKWGKEVSVKEVFDDVFTNILPAVRGVHAGDMTITDLQGNDTIEWENSLFNQKGFTTDLEPTSRYIRLYLTCQPEPIYINIGNLVEEITNGYNVKSSDTIRFEVNDMESTLTAHINIINKSQLTELGIIENKIENPEENAEITN